MKGKTLVHTQTISPNNTTIEFHNLPDKNILMEYSQQPPSGQTIPMANL
jgi:hypothetical protein